MPALVTPLLRGFRTTHWSLIRRAEKGDHTSIAAREELCRDYWYPIYSYLRKLGYEQEAEDLTQEFLADILRRTWLSRADETKGKFRSFLLSSLHLFLGNAADRRRAAKRQGAYLHIPLDTHDAGSRYSLNRTASVDPTLAYEVEWATSVVTNAFKRLELECAEAGKTEHYALLKEYLKKAGDAEGYRAAADAMGTSVANIKVRVHRLRERYGALLQEEIARTVAGPEEVEGEMRHLRAMFSAVVSI